MLTEKDYCDYETCVALKELGFDEKCHGHYEPLKKCFNTTSIKRCWCNSGVDDIGVIICPTLYEAHKWLREEKNIIVEVFVDDDSDTPITYNIYKDGECVCHHHGKYWSVNEWSEALAEGIKQSIEILKEDETIHR